jgi:uncharacterized iron-regulated membrane protein
MLHRDPSANRPSSRRCRIAAGAWCALLLGLAGTHGVAEEDRDHDRARWAVEAGEVLPLRTILERIEREYPGQVIDVELEREHDGKRQGWVYEIKLLRSGGSLSKLKVDARTGAAIGRKERSATEHEREQRPYRHAGEGN